MNLIKLIILIIPPLIYAQDTIKVSQQDSLYIEEHLNEIIEKKAKTAAKLSLLLPGAGQFYNKSYWKIPVIYAILGGIGYSIYKNDKEYKKWRTYYLHKIDNDPNTIDPFPSLSAEVLRSQRDYYRRNRDLGILIFSFAYILNSIEAYVDAHLKEFDVSDNLSIKIYPDIYSITISLNFR